MKEECITYSSQEEGTRHAMQDHTKPCGSTWGSTGVGQEEEGARGMCRPERLQWFLGGRTDEAGLAS